jgi:hypothetical protein
MLASFRASSAPVLTVEAAAPATSRYPSEGASGRFRLACGIRRQPIPPEDKERLLRTEAG